MHARPAEVVEDRQRVQSRADAHGVADRLVDRRQRHRVRVLNGRHHAAGEDDALPARRLRPDHRRVARPDLQRPHERLYDRAALHLVVVLANDPVLAGDVGMREQCEQRLFRGMGFPPMI